MPASPTTGTELPPGSMALPTGVDSIGVVSRSHASSKRGRWAGGCLGQGGQSGDQNDCEHDGPQGDEEKVAPPSLCDVGGSSADYSERLR